MCARTTVTRKDPEEIRKRFKAEQMQGEFKFPRFNIAPTQKAPVVYIDSGKRVLAEFRFGMIPHWAKDEKIASKLIQARADTILERPSYKKPFLERRCLVVCDGWYEWQEMEGGNRPHYFFHKEKELVGIAGIWAVWKNPKGEEVKSFTVITTDADRHVKSVHHRMPVLIKEEQEDTWLNPKVKDPEVLLPMLKSSCAGIKFHPVSTLVNSPKNYDERCIVPL